MQLTDYIHLVGSGRVGFDLTNEFDCHVYLVTDGNEAVVIDAGAGVDIDPILAEIDQTGISRDRITRLLLTHAHADHAGGTRGLHDALGSEVWASEQAAGWICDGNEEAISLDRAKGPGGYPAGYVFRPCPVAGALRDGDRIPVGSLEIEVVASPGHSQGHLSYLLHRPGGTDLFSGDAVFWGGKILLQDIWDCSVTESCATVRRLAALKPDGLYPGHAAIAVNRGYNHLYSAMENILALIPPPQLF